jgi:acetyl esterase/lipase
MHEEKTVMASRKSKRIAMAGWVTVLGMSAIEPISAGSLPVTGNVAAVNAPVTDQGTFSPSMRLQEVVEHPDMLGFGRHILPRPGEAYSVDILLNRIGDLLPYHSNVRPEEMVFALDRLARDVRAGQQVFCPFYTAEEITADPAKADTGLFFLRGQSQAPFAIIAPGGGFSYVGTVHEGLPYATGINAAGFNAFVIRYRVGMGQQAATEDMARAISFIFDNAADLQVSVTDYSVWGSSAGARMAALIGTHGVGAFGGDDLPGPATVVMAYTGHSDIGQAEPPTYAIVGERDGIAPPSSMQRRVERLRQLGTAVEFRIVPGVGHGFGTGLGTPAQGWIGDAVRFWQANTAQPTS